MLNITITPPDDIWNEKTQEFMYFKPITIQLEHSLVSISKWESKWEKPYIGSEKTKEEILDYIRCMTITQNVKPIYYTFISKENSDDIAAYINAPMTATTFTNRGKKSKEIVTSEKIYYWMFTFNIPMECRKWHLNRLMTLIRICSIENSPKKNMSQREVLQLYKEANDRRRKALNSRG